MGQTRFSAVYQSGARILRVITFGTFDVFHVGHLNILESARQKGSHLTVGVSSDALNLNKKGRLPIYAQKDRLRIIKALGCVDAVFVEESLIFAPDQDPLHERFFDAHYIFVYGGLMEVGTEEYPLHISN